MRASTTWWWMAVRPNLPGPMPGRPIDRPMRREQGVLSASRCTPRASDMVRCSSSLLGPLRPESRTIGFATRWIQIFGRP